MSQHSYEFDEEKIKYPKCQTCGQSIEGMPYDCWCDVPSNNDVDVPALTKIAKIEIIEENFDNDLGKDPTNFQAIFKKQMDFE